MDKTHTFLSTRNTDGKERRIFFQINYNDWDIIERIYCIRWISMTQNRIKTSNQKKKISSSNSYVRHIWRHELDVNCNKTTQYSGRKQYSGWNFYFKQHFYCTACTITPQSSYWYCANLWGHLILRSCLRFSINLITIYQTVSHWVR